MGAFLHTRRMTTTNNLRMLQQRVLLTQLVEEPVAVGKLVVPESVAKNVSRGRVVAVDEGKLRVDDEVFFDARQAVPMTIEGQELLVVHESQIIAVINTKKKAKKTA